VNVISQPGRSLMSAIALMIIFYNKISFSANSVITRLYATCIMVTSYGYNTYQVVVDQNVADIRCISDVVEPRSLKLQMRLRTKSLETNSNVAQMAARVQIGVRLVDVMQDV